MSAIVTGLQTPVQVHAEESVIKHLIEKLQIREDWAFFNESSQNGYREGQFLVIKVTENGKVIDVEDPVQMV